VASDLPIDSANELWPVPALGAESFHVVHRSTGAKKKLGNQAYVCTQVLNMYIVIIIEWLLPYGEG
jgi:hypothetical protein